jgi:hypothetical protein
LKKFLHWPHGLGNWPHGLANWPHGLGKWPHGLGSGLGTLLEMLMGFFLLVEILPSNSGLFRI